MRISDWSSDVCSSDLSSIYGDTPSLTGTVSAAGLKNDDGLESVTSGAAIWTSAADATSDVGAYAVAGSGLAGDSGNYRFSFAQDAANATALKIGRASGRERVCQYVYTSGVAVSVNKKYATTRV